MERTIYCIYDLRARTIAFNFFPSENDATAIRQFQEVCAHPESMPARHPDDYELRKLGQVDWQTCRSSELFEPIPVCTARDVIPEQAMTHIRDDLAPFREQAHAEMEAKANGEA